MVRRFAGPTILMAGTLLGPPRREARKPSKPARNLDAAAGRGGPGGRIAGRSAGAVQAPPVASLPGVIGRMERRSKADSTAGSDHTPRRQIRERAGPAWQPCATCALSPG